MKFAPKPIFLTNLFAYKRILRIYTLHLRGIKEYELYREGIRIWDFCIKTVFSSKRFAYKQVALYHQCVMTPIFRCWEYLCWCLLWYFLWWRWIDAHLQGFCSEILYDRTVYESKITVIARFFHDMFHDYVYIIRHVLLHPFHQLEKF